ncbi:MAG TPA: hypothetical protein VFH42_08405, partial [Sporolactobacillaceae bacterium]|nr:hypothetical protein [Sporolactobacillaceae bacterium]
TLLQGVKTLFSSSFDFIGVTEGQRPFIDLLAGTDQLRELVLKEEALRYLTDSKDELEKYSREIKRFELY